MFALYHHWGVALAERANGQHAILATIVPAAISAVLLIRNGKQRTLVRPWSWLRPYVLLFFLSLTAVESAKLVLGGEPVFGPKGQVRQYYVVRSDGAVVVSDHGGIDNSGRTFQPITPDNVDWVSRMRTAGTRLPQKVDPAKSPWFLPGGQAVLFWAEREGRLEFFDRPGKHPETQADLRDVTPEIRARWEAEQRKAAEAKLRGQVSGLEERITKLEHAPAPAPQKSAEDRQPSVEATPMIVQPTLSLVTARPRSSPPSPVSHIEPPQDDITDLDPLTPPSNRNSLTNPAPVPKQIPPLHLNCGTRHWRWARCPRYGLPHPRCGVPRHFRCGHFHWPSEPCPANDFQPLCQRF
jgi:hypothetical protein